MWALGGDPDCWIKITFSVRAVARVRSNRPVAFRIGTGVRL